MSGDADNHVSRNPDRSAIALSQRLTLLCLSCLTLIAATMIAPALPAMARAFPAVPNADYLSRIALTITALAIAIAAPLAGALADRFGRKRILSLSLLVFTLAGASGLFLDDLYWIVASRFVLGMATAGIHTAVIALIGDHFTGAERARYMGLQHAVVSFSGVVLFSVAGAISEISWRTPFAFYLIGVILLPAALAWITEPRRVHPSNDPRHRRWRPGVSLSLVCGLGFLFVTGTHVIPIYLPFLVAEDGGPARLGGFGLALFMASSAAAASFYGRIKNGLGFSAVFRAGFGLLALGLAFVGVAEGLLLLSCGLVLVGASLGTLVPNSHLWVTEHVAAQFRASALGILTSCFYLGQFACPFLTQPIVASAGVRQAIAVTAMLMAGVSILSFARPLFRRLELRLRSSQ